MHRFAKVVALASIVGVGSLLGWAGEKGRAKPPTPSAEDNAPRTNRRPAASNPRERRAAEWKEFADYRTWRPIHAEPIEVPPEFSRACEAYQPEKESPHAGRFISVYVNPTGRKTYLAGMPSTSSKAPNAPAGKPAVFPEGAVIVKAKLRAKTSRTPDELGIMIKRQKGYDPDAGDWQFLFVDHEGQLTTDRKQLTGCIDCHANRSDTAFVFRRENRP